MDIRNLLDYVVVLETLAGDVKEARKDDADIDLWDIPKFTDMLPALKAAKEGSELIVAEIKDMDPAEARILIDRGIAAVAALVEALTTVPKKD
jgi:hypothetical protein